MTNGAVLARPRVFLFLQGPSSSLFIRLAERLEAEGHRCLRVNLNAGDWLFWRKRGGINYRRGHDEWPAFIDDILTAHGVTDMILLGEERPYHRVAVEKASTRGIDVTVIEMGYLRPDWITVERDGMSSNSRFPADAGRISAAARELPSPSMKPVFTQSFFMEAMLDLSYNLPNVLLSVLFPGYRRHGLFHPLLEYGGWVVRLIGARRRRRNSLTLLSQVLASQRPFFIYPLQLETDYQLRAHSPYGSQKEAIEEIVTSFATCASPDSDLIAKVHPLDNGLIDWQGFLRKVAKAQGVEGRVHYMDGGNLDSLVGRSAGMVTVNSTAAFSALQTGVPVKALGAAIYDIDGITHQGTLDCFWSNPAKPDRQLTGDFIRLLAASIQVRGNFYSKRGVDAAASAIVQRLLTGRINSNGGDCGFAPRVRPLKSILTSRGNYGTVSNKELLSTCLARFCGLH